MRRYDRFKLTAVTSGMIGGHYAVEDDFGRTIGVDLRLDKTRANQLCVELNKAFDRGVEHGEKIRAE